MNSLAIYDIFYKYCSISETGEFYLINPKFDSPYDISADIDDMIREEEANAECICREICDDYIYVISVAYLDENCENQIICEVVKRIVW